MGRRMVYNESRKGYDRNVPFIMCIILYRSILIYKEQSVEKVRIKIYLRITKVQYNLITNEY